MYDENKKRPLLPASEVLQGLLQNSKSPLSDQFLRWKLWRQWAEVVGPFMSTHCYPVGYEKGTLYVFVKNSSLLQEFTFLSSEIRQKINLHLGKNWIYQIRFSLNQRSVPNPEMSDGEFMKEFFDRSQGV